MGSLGAALPAPVEVPVVDGVPGADAPSEVEVPPAGVDAVPSEAGEPPSDDELPGVDGLLPPLELEVVSLPPPSALPESGEPEGVGGLGVDGAEGVLAHPATASRATASAVRIAGWIRMTGSPHSVEACCEAGTGASPPRKKLRS